MNATITPASATAVAPDTSATASATSSWGAARVNIEINWPPDADAAVREEIFAHELEHGRELAEAGHMERLWRVPGRWANWGLWEAADPAALHDVLTSLPLWPWMDVTVHVLATHVNDPADMDLG